MLNTLAMAKAATVRHWLMKSEPTAYSIDDLRRDGRTGWDGIRNYQARNLMRDEMRVGDRVLFYHSSCKPPGVVGLAKISGAARPDPSAFDAKSPYYDAKSSPEEPRWLMVEVEFVACFEDIVTLDVLEADPALSEMLVVRRGQRLSIQPVMPADFERVCRLAGI